MPFSARPRPRHAAHKRVPTQRSGNRLVFCGRRIGVRGPGYLFVGVQHEVVRQCRKNCRLCCSWNAGGHLVTISVLILWTTRVLKRTVHPQIKTLLLSTPPRTSFGRQTISSFPRSLKTPNFTCKLTALLRTLSERDFIWGFLRIGWCQARHIIDFITSCCLGECCNTVLLCSSTIDSQKQESSPDFLPARRWVDKNWMLFFRHNKILPVHLRLSFFPSVDWLMCLYVYIHTLQFSDLCL